MRGAQDKEGPNQGNSAQNFQKSFPVTSAAAAAYLQQASDTAKSEAQTSLDVPMNLTDEKGMSPLSIGVSSTYQDGGQPSPASSGQSLTNHALRYQTSGAAGDAMLSAINTPYNENEMLHEGGFDVSRDLGNLEDGILGSVGNSTNLRLSENAPTSTFDLFDGEGNVNDAYQMEGHSDLQLSPQTFVDSPSTFNINDNSALGSIDQDSQGHGKIYLSFLQYKLCQFYFSSLFDCMVYSRMAGVTSSFQKIDCFDSLLYLSSLL